MMNTDIYDDPELYDAVYADIVADLPWLVRLTQEANGPVLEVCCGNGRVMVPALQAGAEVDGLDLSSSMLEALRVKVASAQLRAGIHQGDMTSFSLPRRYALVLIAFNSFLHNLTQKAQLDTLRCCQEHLAPGGRLSLVLFHPAADKLVEWAAGEKLIKDIVGPDGIGRVRVADTTIDDRIEQVRDVTRRVEFRNDSGAITSVRTFAFRLRYIFKPEMELLLRAAGFGRWNVRPLDAGADGAWSPSDRAPREGDTLLWSAWKD